MGPTCSCDCHANPYLPCSINGGCGGEHKDGGCTLCPVLRPGSAARDPHRPPVCDGDRGLLSRYLGEINHLVSDLADDEQPIINERRYERIGVEYLHKGGGARRAVSLGNVWADPVAALGGVAPINSRSKQPSVSGSRERPIPIPVTALDLKTNLRPGHHLRPLPTITEDQIGQLPAAVILAEWIRDIRDTLWPTSVLPKPGVRSLTTWLRDRLDDICDRYSDVAVFAESVRLLRGSLRAAAGEIDARPEPCTGIPCKRCDLATLFRQDGDVTCMNPDCQAILRADEYNEWLKTLAAEHGIKRRTAATR